MLFREAYHHEYALELFLFSVLCIKTYIHTCIHIFFFSHSFWDNFPTVDFRTEKWQNLSCYWCVVLWSFKNFSILTFPQIKHFRGVGSRVETERNSNPQIFKISACIVTVLLSTSGNLLISVVSLLHSWNKQWLSVLQIDKLLLLCAALAICSLMGPGENEPSMC